MARRILEIKKDTSGKFEIVKDNKSLPKELHFFIINVLKAIYNPQTLNYESLNFNPHDSLCRKLSQLKTNEFIPLSYSDIPLAQANVVAAKKHTIEVVKGKTSYYINGLSEGKKWYKDLLSLYQAKPTANGNLKTKNNPVKYFQEILSKKLDKKFNVHIEFVGFESAEKKSELSQENSFTCKDEGENVLVVRGTSKDDPRAFRKALHNYGAIWDKKDNSWKLFNNGNPLELLSSQKVIYKELKELKSSYTEQIGKALKEEGISSKNENISENISKSLKYKKPSLGLEIS